MSIRGRDGRKWLTAAMAAAVLVMGGCAGTTMNPDSPVSVSTPTPPAQPAQASITLCNQTPSGCASGVSFSLATLRDLVIRSNWSNVPAGTHTQTTELIEPTGGLFTVNSQAFVIDDNSNGTVQTEVILPVSGTLIAQRRISGAWSVRVSLDTSVSVTQAVRIEP